MLLSLVALDQELCFTMVDGDFKKFNGKWTLICDFGLAKWLSPDADQQHVTRFEGTFRYSAPEYLTPGIIDEKTDVYAFGILLLEILTRRKAYAKPLIDAYNVKELVDPSLGEDYDRAGGTSFFDCFSTVN
ncbi:Receptor-like cytosolic serine/threonine-protein kinase [Arachis hypogaea]|nr:Receptor-like cytosolic serine/threonine-protein kinase [Arachis hypogaea]